MNFLIVTTMRNEGPFILEWIAHHKALGVTDFLIFSNDCDDGTDRLLDCLHELGEVDHVPHRPKAGKSIQWQALKAAREHPVMARADWIAVLDCDEFICLKAPLQGLDDLVGAVPADAIAMRWRLFGAAGHLRFQDAMVTERFVQSAPTDAPIPAATGFFKTLYRNDRALFATPGIHRPRTAGDAGPRWVDGSGNPLPSAIAGNDKAILLPRHPDDAGLVQLNHYSLRSAEDFLVKRRRGLPNRSAKDLDAGYWAERNFNIVEDRSALRHGAGALQEVRRLRADAGVAAAHSHCIQRHLETIEEILRDPAEVRLLMRLALMQTSVPPAGAKLAYLADRARSAFAD